MSLSGFCLASGWGLATRKNKRWLEAWNIQSHHHHLGKGEGLEIDLMIDHVCVLKPLYRSWKYGMQLASRCWIHGGIGRAACFWRGPGSSAWLLPSPSLSLPYEYSCVSLIISFYNPAVNVFPWVLWVILASYQIQGRGHGNPHLQVVDQKYRWQTTIRNWHLPWRMEVLWDWTFNLWDLMLSPGRSELSEIVGHPASSVAENCLVWGKTFTHLVTRSIRGGVLCESQRVNTQEDGFPVQVVLSMAEQVSYRASHSPLILTHGGGKSNNLTFLGVVETAHHCHCKASSWIWIVIGLRVISMTVWTPVCSSQHECYTHPWWPCGITWLFLHISRIRLSFIEDTRNRHGVLVLLSKCKPTYFRRGGSN